MREYGEYSPSAYRLRVLLRIVFFLAVIAVLLGAAYYFLSHYRIDPNKTYVEGNDHYTADEIIDLVMTGPLGDNSIYLSLKYKDRKISDIPFVDAITVSVIDSDSVRISVFEKALAGYVKYLDHYVYFDKDGYVVESSNVMTAGIPQVSGLSFDSVEVGKKLGTEDGGIFERTLDLTKLMNKYDLLVDKIYFHESGAVTLYFGNVRVSLGNDQKHLEDKIMDLPQFLEKLEGLSGILNMEKYDEDFGIYVFTKDAQ